MTDGTKSSIENGGARLNVISGRGNNGVKVRIKDRFEAVCPVDGHIDTYTLSIEYYPSGGRILELKSFSQYLNEFREREIAQEELCGVLYEDIESILAPEDMRVSVFGEHYGLEVRTIKGGGDN